MNITVINGLITLDGLDAETAGALAKALSIAVPHLDGTEAQLISFAASTFKAAALAAVCQQHMPVAVCDNATQFVNSLIGEQQ